MDEEDATEEELEELEDELEELDELDELEDELELELAADEDAVEDVVAVLLLVTVFEEDVVFPPQADNPNNRAADEMRTSFSFFILISFLKLNCFFRR